jgi:hypothetical protein
MPPTRPDGAVRENVPDSRMVVPRQIRCENARLEASVLGALSNGDFQASKLCGPVRGFNKNSWVGHDNGADRWALSMPDVAQKIVDAFWKKLEQTQESQYRAFDSAKLARLASYVPAPDEIINGTIIRRLYETIKEWAEQIPLLKYPNEYLFVSTKPDQEQKRQVLFQTTALPPTSAL